MLLLDGGSAASALHHFERYLRAPSADLAPEALWGKSQALARLGRGDDARAMWELIVTRYPDCAYAKAAGAKLSVH
jgi:TolA-binding protein